MYKLVAVGGKLRGTEYELGSEETIVGRDASADISIAVEGVSKRHFKISAAGDALYLEDLDSSNGTYLNGKLIKRATIQDKDQIAIPNVIFQLVYVKENKIIIKRQADDQDETEDWEKGGTPPKTLPRKLLFMFKYRLMNFLYGINQEYEWRILLGIITAVFVVTTITMTILPVLGNSNSVLKKEIAARGSVYAEMVAKLNSRALEQKNLDQIDTSFLENEPGIHSYELFDLDGRVVRPIGKLNSYIQDTFSIQAKDWALKKHTKDQGIMQLPGGMIGIARRVMAYNPKFNDTEAVGVIAIKFAPESMLVEAKRNQKDYCEALVTSALVAIVFGLMIYYLTIRHMEEFRFQLDEALRGKRKIIESKYLMGELAPLRSSINSMLQRIRELQNEDDDDFEEAEDDSTYVMQLQEFMHGANGPVIVLDSEKNLVAINGEAEDITGIRETSSKGLNIVDVTREKGFAGRLVELCDMSASNNGTNQNQDYELSGKNYSVNVACLIGKDSFAKAYYITFIRED